MRLLLEDVPTADEFLGDHLGVGKDGPTSQVGDVNGGEQVGCGAEPGQVHPQQRLVVADQARRRAGQPVCYDATASIGDRVYAARAFRAIDRRLGPAAGQTLRLEPTSFGVDHRLGARQSHRSVRRTDLVSS